MNETPCFLPPMVNLDGSYEEIIERLYDIFRKDFIENRARHLGRDVSFNGIINQNSQGKVEGFWHVITCDNPTGAERLIDYQRAKRLPWSKPLMENPAHEKIKFFCHEEGTDRKGVRHYIWFEDGDYVVILKRRKYDYFWITSFYVDREKKEALWRKYGNHT